MINLTIALIISALIYFIVAHHSVMDKLAEKYPSAYMVIGVITFSLFAAFGILFIGGLFLTAIGVEV